MRVLHISIPEDQREAFKTRGIHITNDGFAALPIHENDLSFLYERAAIYDCGDGHDLHLDPACEFTLEGVEALCLALHLRRKQ